MVISHRLVHELVSHGVAAVAFECIGQLVPHDEVLLGFFRGEQRVGIGIPFERRIEIVRADDVQVDNGAQMVLLCPADGVVHQLPGFGQFAALLVPELHLVDGQAHKVEA